MSNYSSIDFDTHKFVYYYLAWWCGVDTSLNYILIMFFYVIYSGIYSLSVKWLSIDLISWLLIIKNNYIFQYQCKESLVRYYQIWWFIYLFSVYALRIYWQRITLLIFIFIIFPYSINRELSDTIFFNFNKWKEYLPKNDQRSHFFFHLLYIDLSISHLL